MSSLGCGDVHCRAEILYSSVLWPDGRWADSKTIQRVRWDTESRATEKRTASQSRFLGNRGQVIAYPRLQFSFISSGAGV